MELIGFCLMMVVPTALWNQMETPQQVEILELVSQKFFNDYSCQKADVIIEKHETQVRFLFKCKEWRM